MDLGHSVLSKKFLAKLTEEMKLAEIAGAGIKLCIMKESVDKYKNKIKGGHISDTLFDKYTNVIPDDVLKRKNDVEKCKVFDKFVIYHFYDDKLEEKKEKKEKISQDEKAAMRDPILFGVCKEMPDRLFFIADWEDDVCDLCFSDLIDKLKLDDEDVSLPESSEFVEK
jgi:hypothetical protein